MSGMITFVFFLCISRKRRLFIIQSVSILQIFKLKIFISDAIIVFVFLILWYFLDIYEKSTQILILGVFLAGISTVSFHAPCFHLSHSVHTELAERACFVLTGLSASPQTRSFVSVLIPKSFSLPEV